MDSSDGPDFLGDYLIAVLAPGGLGQVGGTLDVSLRICATSDCFASQGQDMYDGDSSTFTSRALSVTVPEPVSGLLLATGLATLVAIRRRRNTA